MSLQGKRVAILVENYYDEKEFWYPYFRFQEEEAEVRVIGSGSAEVYKSKGQIEIKPDAPADAVSAAQFDAVIVPGGFAPDYLRRYEAVLRLVRDAFNQGKVVASVCHGAWVLISAGIVAGKRATCLASIKDDLKNAGATYLDEPVVVDGKMITSRRPADLPVFCRAIIRAMQE